MLSVGWEEVVNRDGGREGEMQLSLIPQFIELVNMNRGNLLFLSIWETVKPVNR